MTRPKIYMAGPDVFFIDALDIAAKKKEILAAHGLEGLHPFDNNILPDVPREAQAQLIKDKNCEMMRDADAILANLTPYRGPSADVGTAYEVGFMEALGKPVYAYSNRTDDFLSRIKATHPLKKDPQGEWRDADGLLVEDFGLFDNLMLGCALATPISVASVAPEDLYADLESFKAAVRLMAKHLENLRSYQKLA